jgi:hypothetical protein
MPALALLATVGFWTWFLTPHPGDGITRSNYERLKEGMTLAEVEAVLGVPEGNYSGNAYTPILIHPRLEGPASSLWLANGRHAIWFGEKVGIAVTLDEGGKVNRKAIEDLELQQTLSERLRRLLPW